MIHGFIRVATATPECSVADCGENTAQILALVKEAASKGVSIIVFPELSITGYTCGDLFSQELLSRISLAAIRLIAEKTKDISISIVVGFPFNFGNSRYNCAAVISRGKVRGVVPKTHIPNYGEFYELRHFSPSFADSKVICAGVIDTDEVPFGTDILFCDEKNHDLAFAIEICEDLWVPHPPSADHVQAGAVIIANLSASNEIIGKHEYRKNLILQQSGRGICAYLYAAAGSGESTTDLVFSGHNVIAENGSTLAESKLFSSGLLCADIDIRRLLQERRRLNTFTNLQREYRKVYFTIDVHHIDSSAIHPPIPRLRIIEKQPFVPTDNTSRLQRCEEVLAIQTAGLKKRLSHTGIKNVVIGLSGGLDSTLALLVTIRAFDSLNLCRSGIVCVTMPGFGTTKHTKSNALKLAEVVGATVREISINKAVKQHFNDIGHDSTTLDVTYENSQARERTQVLMDIANMCNGIVIGTGDLSELALGWATYNGDHMSMYALNASIPKTLVRHLVSYCAQNAQSFISMKSKIDSSVLDSSHHEDLSKEEKAFNKILVSILETPVSPELLPPCDGIISQETETIIGPYELHDFFLYYITRWGFSPAKILLMAEQAFAPHTYTNVDILKWMKVFYKRFFSQQFKRSCLPDGPKVGSVTLSPRGDWRMPSDASAAVWLKEVESL